MGLVIFAALGLYLLISIIVVIVSARIAKKKDRNPWAWGFGAAFIMYNLVFWDWIPTVVAHKYYCSTEAGFWVYKTVDQWKAENPGVAKELISPVVSPSTHTDKELDHITIYSLNKRFNWVVKKTGPLPINRWRWEQVVEDSKTHQVLARYVDFSTGNGDIGGELELRFWRHADHCGGGAMNGGKLSTIMEDVYNLGLRE